MKRVTQTMIAACAAVGLLAGTALADSPTITITSPTQGQLVETTTFPKNVSVQGTISHTGGSGNNINLCAVSNFAVTVDDGDEATDPVVIGGQNWNAGNDPTANCPTSEAFSYTFTATEPGVYTVTAFGKHANETETETVDFEVVLQELVVSYPAAPSVAAQILSDAGVSARYGSGKAGGNHIADVAAEMNLTPGTDFRGVAKREVAAYAAKVHEFLVQKGAL